MFKTGWFKLHSGDMSSYKINCDCLTKEDWETLARIIANKISFRVVYGIREGGVALANALKQYEMPFEDYPALVVDDVLTTGASMEEMKKKIVATTQRKKCVGVVLFARGKCPGWVKPIFSTGKDWLK